MKPGFWKRVDHDLFTHVNRFRDFTGSLDRMSSTKLSGRFALAMLNY